VKTDDTYQAEKGMKEESSTEPLMVALNELFQPVSERNPELLEFKLTLE
jgi:hypothetical protein